MKETQDSNIKLVQLRTPVEQLDEIKDKTKRLKSLQFIDWLNKGGCGVRCRDISHSARLIELKQMCTNIIDETNCEKTREKEFTLDWK